MEEDIKVFDLLTLDDDNKYAVGSIVRNNDVTYLLIVDVNNNKNIKFVEKYVYNSEIHLRVVEDTNLIQELLPLFLKNGVEALNSVNLDDFIEK